MNSSFIVSQFAGAVKGATSRQTLGLLDTWLRLIKDVYRLHRDHLDMIEVHLFKHRIFTLEYFSSLNGFLYRLLD